ncbi:MAG: MarR family winged helix-turn-helix transcriptional regulator [Steroidobacteraceae bacterium]
MRPAAGSPRLDRGLLSGHVGPRVRLLRNLLMSRVTAALAPFGLSHGALSAMTLIAANAHCSQMQIARDLGMEKSAVTTIVDELVRRRLVARSRSAEDRRRNALSLTPKGERTMQAMHAAATAEEGPMERALDPGEFDQFLSLLDRAYEALAAARL